MSVWLDVFRGISRSIYAFPSVDDENNRIAKHIVSFGQRLKSRRLTGPAVAILEPCAACCRRRQEHCQPPSLLVADR